MRKFLFLLVLPLLLAVAVSVSAATKTEPIALGETKDTSVRPGQVEEYTFTPTESGEYALCLEETGANFQSWCCLDGNATLPERYYWVAGWEGKVFSLQAGRTYTFRLTNNTGWGGDRKIRLEKVTATTTLEVRVPAGGVYPGELIWAAPILDHPGAVSGTFHWTSSDPSVARIEGYEDIQAAVLPVAPGTTTITVTVNGLSASYELTVQDYQQIPIGGSVDYTIAPETKYIFTIKPKESGRYAVWNEEPGIDITVTDAGIGKNFYGSHENSGFIYNLRAGVTYKCYVVYPGDTWGTLEDAVHVEKVRPVQSVSLEGDSSMSPVGSVFRLHAVVDPVYGVIEGVSWSCSDPDVLQLMHMDSNSAYCEAKVLKEGKATVTVTVGGVSASWEYGVIPVPEFPRWQQDTPVTLPILQDQFTTNVFVPAEDGYYRFSATADRDVFFMVYQNYGIGADRIWASRPIRPGQEGSIELYLQEGVPYILEISGSEQSGGTFAGKVERMHVTEKEVSRIEINSSPVPYEFGNDDYGIMIDGAYLFRPLGYEGMLGLSFTVHYADGTSAVVSENDLTWEDYTNVGLMQCWWNGCPVEITLMLEDGTPADQIEMFSHDGVMVRLRYMGVSAEFVLVVEPGHTHQLVFNEREEPTPEMDGLEAHYVCLTCGKIYFDAEATDRVRDPGQLDLFYTPEGGDHVVDEDALQDAVQQIRPGESFEVPVPEGATAVVMPKDALETFSQQGNTLQIPLDQATVSLDAATLAAITAQAQEPQITLKLQQVGQEMLNQEQQQVLRGHDTACVISAEILCGEQAIHDFGGGTVTVRVAFAAEPGSTYRVIYIADDGTVEDVPCRQLDGCMEFTTGQFSNYAIVRVGHDGFPWAAVAAAAAVVTVAAAFVIVKRRKKA